MPRASPRLLRCLDRDGLYDHSACRAAWRIEERRRAYGGNRAADMIAALLPLLPASQKWREEEVEPPCLGNGALGAGRRFPFTAAHPVITLFTWILVAGPLVQCDLLDIPGGCP